MKINNNLIFELRVFLNVEITNAATLSPFNHSFFERFVTQRFVIFYFIISGKRDIYFSNCQFSAVRAERKNGKEKHHLP